MKKFTRRSLWFIVLTLFLSPAAARAGNIRLRLREHFDTASIQLRGAPSERYFGLNSTANLWYEEKGEYAIGLAFNPVVPGRFKVQGAAYSPFTDRKVTLWLGGVEGKYFFTREFGLFARGGAYFSVLDTDTSLGGNRKGFAWYAGLGWEIPVWDGKIGLAPEIAIRHAVYGHGYHAVELSPSFGLHFYVRDDVLKVGE